MKSITHAQAVRLIHRCLDGLLNDSQNNILDEHLSSCDSCRAYAAGLESFSDRLKNEFHARWDKKLGSSPEVIQQVVTKARRIPMANRFSGSIKLLAGAAALVVLGFLVNFVVSQFRSTTTPAMGNVNNSILAEDRLLAFTSKQDGNMEVYTVHADGSSVKNITNNPAYDANPVWSPDGRHIAFVSNRHGGDVSQLFLMDADGSHISQLTTNEGDHMLPSFMYDKSNLWSPDGSKLLYLQLPSRFDTEWVLQSIDVNNGNVISLGTGRFDITGISWSPDGKSVGFIRNDPQNKDENKFVPEMNVVSADGTKLININRLLPSNETLNFATNYYWSQDGKSVFFVVYKHIDEGKDQWIACEADLNNSNLIQRATSSTPMYDWWDGTSFITGLGGDPLTWLRADGTYSVFKAFDKCKTSDDPPKLNRRSSNGVLIVGVGCSNNEWWFYRASPDGRVIQQLLDSPMVGNLEDIIWSQDDEFVAFMFTSSSSDKTSLYIVNIDDALKNPSVQAKQVTIDSGPPYVFLSWQPIP